MKVADLVNVDGVLMIVVGVAPLVDQRKIRFVAANDPVVQQAVAAEALRRIG